MDAVFAIESHVSLAVTTTQLVQSWMVSDAAVVGGSTIQQNASLDRPNKVTSLFIVDLF
jgi:hypothetical protein